MKTYIIPESEVENYRKAVLSEDFSCFEEVKIRTELILGYTAIELEDAKRQAKIGDCLLIKYVDKLVPMQVIDKKWNNGRLDVTLQSYYLLEQRAFDQNTNVWKDAEIRKYLNGEFLTKFDPEFVDALQTTDVHTDNYVTKDKMWLLSHEEIGYKDDSGMFKPNVGSRVYDYYKDDSTEEFKKVAE